MASGKRLILQLLVLCLAAPAVRSGWLQGTATFYGGSDGSGTMGGACGYSNLYDEGYGLSNAALSTVLFNDGASCGQCYLIICDQSKSPMCKTGKAITVTATNLCPPNYNLPNDNGGWCNPPRPHFDMSQPAWLNIGIYEAGIIPIVYQQVKCWRTGGLRFTILGFNYFELVLVTNVAGSGSIKSISVKGTNTGWTQMSRNWGVIWQGMSGLAGQSLSFSISSTGGQNIVFQNVIPAGWTFGQTYSTWQQFDY
ncbi:expansin-A18-like [Lolium rigidum]|uniref:expansin-A18-like n=1 Tax=Lolium rigidum TaxID=89674 RepID=UPI001F5D19E5|nr:expansin-A18-like [Lolium rigidum]